MTNSFVLARNKDGRVKRQKKPWKATSAMSERPPLTLADFRFVRLEDLQPLRLEDLRPFTAEDFEQR